MHIEKHILLLVAAYSYITFSQLCFSLCLLGFIRTICTLHIIHPLLLFSGAYIHIVAEGIPRTGQHMELRMGLRMGLRMEHRQQRLRQHPCQH
jgi:hypothetical protein